MTTATAGRHLVQNEFIFTFEFRNTVNVFSTPIGLNFKRRYRKLAIVVRVVQNTENLVISGCFFAEDGKEMYQDSKRTCTAIVLLMKPFVLLSLLSPSPLWFAKTPYWPEAGFRKQKIHSSCPYGEISTKKEPMRTLGFTLTTVSYNKGSYFQNIEFLSNIHSTYMIYKKLTKISQNTFSIIRPQYCTVNDSI